MSLLTDEEEEDRTEATEYLPVLFVPRSFSTRRLFLVVLDKSTSNKMMYTPLKI